MTGKQLARRTSGEPDPRKLRKNLRKASKRLRRAEARRDKAHVRFEARMIIVDGLRAQLEAALASQAKEQGDSAVPAVDTLSQRTEPDTACA